MKTVLGYAGFFLVVWSLSGAVLEYHRVRKQGLAVYEARAAECALRGGAYVSTAKGAACVRLLRGDRP